MENNNKQQENDIQIDIDSILNQLGSEIAVLHVELAKAKAINEQLVNRINDLIEEQ